MTKPGYTGKRTKWVPRGEPTPREIECLLAVADGCSLSVAADRTGRRVTDIASILSTLYTRLGIKDLPGHRLSHSRRQRAVEIVKREGWWPEG